MKDLRIKIKRQTEILGLVIAASQNYQITDLADLYNVDSLTIKRDLQYLNSVLLPIILQLIGNLF